VIGRLERLPRGVRDTIVRTVEESSKNTGLILCLAFNYGGRTEIADAARKIAEDVKAGKLRPKDVNEQAVADRLYTAGMKDPDLLIRTAGEKRISNFLLWQLSYTEFWFTSVCWPDFREKHLMQAFRDFARRTRKFGGLKE